MKKDTAHSESLANEHNHIGTNRLPKTPFTDWLPLLTVVFYIIGLAVLFSTRLDPTLNTFLSLSMGFFFVFFSMFKLINLSGFAQGYHEYDIISKRWFGWGYIYPFIELTLGTLYLLEVSHPLLHSTAIGLSFVVCVGVGQKLAKQELHPCACLGTVLKVPLTKISLFEYIVMAVMGLLMLLLPVSTERLASDHSHHDTFLSYQVLKGEAYDKAFLHEMLEHHQGAVDMARLVIEKSKRPELVALAKQIDATQSMEIDSMKLWQNEWFPNNSSEDHTMHEAMHNMNDELSSLDGNTFEKRFIELMIEHHRDAIDMSLSGSANASYNEIKVLTERIVITQSQEIAQMQAWQHAWGFN